MNARGGKGDQSKDGPRKMPGGWILGFLLGIAVSLAACAVLYPTVTEFNATSLLAYASMTVGARFERMNAKTGERLWESEHQVKEGKLATDTRSMQEAPQFAALQSYTPYVQQVLNVSLATLPDGPRAAAAPAQTGCLMPGGTK